jgi:hypothetical protein
MVSLLCYAPHQTACSCVAQTETWCEEKNVILFLHFSPWFFLGGFAIAAASSYVANHLYDGISAAYMYVADKADTAKEAAARLATKRRRDKEAKLRKSAQVFRQRLREKYGSRDRN